MRSASVRATTGTEDWASLTTARTIAVGPAYSVDKSADGIGRLNRPTLDTSLPLLLTVVNIENGARLL